MRIIITAGASGGHIFPALAVAQEIKRRGFSDIVFVVEQNPRMNKVIEEAGFRFETLSVPKMPYGLSLVWPFFIMRLINSNQEAKRLIKGLNANMAIGFGAYTAGIAINAAHSLKMKTLIHEQNCEIGRANRLLLNKADRVCLTFENRLLGKNPKYILTGNPIRQGLLHDFKTLTKDAAMSQLGLSFNKKTILVLGGSAGASFINKLVMDMASGLSESEKEAIQIIHITGKNDFEAVSKHYRNKIITSWVRDFYERVGLLYKAADIIVCRCGATTIAEICLFGIPAILIPYPGAGSHQKENAQILEKKAKAILLDQAIITADELKMWVWGIISNKKKTQDMSQAMRSLSNADAAVKVADTAQELINAE